MICTESKAKKKKCLPLSKAQGMDQDCVGSDCMAWEWVKEEQEHHQQIYRCETCHMTSPLQSTCHSAVMPLVPYETKALKERQGYCEEIKRGKG